MSQEIHQTSWLNSLLHTLEYSYIWHHLSSVGAEVIAITQVDKEMPGTLQRG